MKGRFNIVIEGVDGTGKSTLAERLFSEIPRARIGECSEGKPESRQGLLLGLARARSTASLDGVTIFDRHPAISEACYRDNGGLTLGQVQQELIDCHIDAIIWARRSLDKLKLKVRNDDPRDIAYNKTLKARLPEIAERYEIIMPALMDFMLYTKKHFDIYTGWEDEYLTTLFISKISALQAIYAKS